MKTLLKKSTAVHAGSLKRKSGFDGSMILELNSNIQSIKKTIQYIWIEHDNYIVPYKVEKCVKKNEHEFAIKLLEFDSENKISMLLYKNVYTDKKDIAFVKLSNSFEYNIADFTIKDNTSQKCGTVINIIEHPKQVLIEAIFDGKEVLIPFTEDWIDMVDEKQKVITMNLPEGLISIND